MGEYIKIAVLDNEIEAQLLGSILAERQIPYVLRSYYDVAYDGMFQSQQGWGCVYAPHAFQQEISEIIRDLQR